MWNHQEGITHKKNWDFKDLRAICLVKYAELNYIYTSGLSRLNNE